MARILITRFSALGDVAMTIPVICSLAKQYPQHHFTLLSRISFQPLFAEMPSNFSFIDAQLTGKHKGILGLNQLYSELKPLQFDYLADLHDVLRTKYLRTRFKWNGVKVAVIDKGRDEKKRLVQKNNKVFTQLATSFERYVDVFKQLGLPINIQFESVYGESKGELSLIEPIVGKKQDGDKWIGIAPFAKHDGKIYPLALQEQVVAHFANKPGIRVFLFGGGAKEQAVFEAWIAKYPSLTSLIGKLNMSMELNLISHLDVMLSMDSANMHLASLVHTPVVSVWGATHPYAGFMGWNQNYENAVQQNIACRPCSVFGQKPCHRQDYVCLSSISPNLIIEKIENIITH